MSDEVCKRQKRFSEPNKKQKYVLPENLLIPSYLQLRLEKYWILVSKNPPIHHHLTCSNIIKIPKKRQIQWKIGLVSKLNLNNHIDIVRNWGQKYFEWRLSNWISSLWCVSVRCAHYNCYLYAWIKLPSIDNRLFNQTNKTILIKVL